MERPPVSVVVLTRGLSLPLARLLRSLGQSRGCDRAELMIGVNGGIETRIAELAARLAPNLHTEVVELERSWPSFARNRLAVHARSDVLLFLDDDVEVGPDTLVRASELVAGAVMVAGGPNLTPPSAPAFEDLAGKVLASPLGAGPVRDRYRLVPPRPATGRKLTLCNMAVRRDAFLAEGFDGGLACAEENDLLARMRRAGGLFVHHPDLAVYHHRRATLRRHAAQMAKYGFGRGQMLVRTPSLRQVPYLGPAFALGSVLALAAFRPLVAAAVAVAYLAVMLVASVRLGGLRSSLTALTLFVTTHLGYSLGTVGGVGFEFVHRILPTRQSSDDRMSADVVKTLVSLVTALLAGIAAGILIARSLGPSGRGVFEFGRVVSFTIAMPAAFGLGRAAVFLKRRERLTPAGMFGGVVGTLATASAGAGVLAIVLLAADGWNPLTPLQTVLACASLPLISFSIQAETGLRGLAQTAWFRRSLALRNLLFCALVIPAILIDSAPSAVLAAWLAQWSITALALAVVLWRICGRPQWPRGMTLRLFAFGIPQTVAVLSAQAHLRLDVLMLQAYRGSAEVGRYAVAYGAAELLTVAATAVGFCLFPRTATATAEDPAGGAVRTAAVLRTVIAITVVGAVFLAFAGPELIEFFFGTAFASAGTSLRLLLPGMVGLSVLIVMANDFAGRGRPWLSLIASGSGVLANVGLNLFLVPRFGATGAALASSFTYTFAAAIAVVVFCASTRTAMRRSLVVTRADLRALAASMTRATA